VRGTVAPVDGAGAVDAAIAAEGPRDAVKVMLDEIPPGSPTIGDEALARLRVAATAFDIPLVAHVGRLQDVDRALAVPVDLFAHSPYAGTFTEAQLAALVERRIPVQPTLTPWASIAAFAAGEPLSVVLQDEVLTGTNRRDLARAERGDARFEGVLALWAAEVAAHRDDRVENVRRLREAGVPLRVGSDAPFLGLAAGPATHLELDLLREAGLGAAEVLSAATWGNSRFLDERARFGAVREGWEADLILVQGDPIADPDAIHRILEVWVDGRRAVRSRRSAP
jgi:imidazolonepropionase-like amidohydrolase